MRLFTIGEIIGPQGIKGEVRVWSDPDSLKLYEKLDRVFLYMGDEGYEMEIQRARPHKNIALVKFKRVDDREAAEKLRGGLLKIPEDKIEPLGEDEYFTGDLYDMAVFTEEGEDLGFIKDIIETGANDVYDARDGKGNRLLIPAIKDCIRQVDIKNQKMTVALLPGLREAAGSKTGGR